MNKASGGDGIPAELFHILKDDAMKVLHSVCQQIWKTQQGPRQEIWKCPGASHPKMRATKGRFGRALAEAKEIKKTCKECTE